MRSLLLTAIVLIVACTDSTDRAREIARVRAHLEGAERELVASTPPGLTITQRANRERVIADLHRYIEAEAYPTNGTELASTPIFIGDDGARCAMAALIEASGDHAMVERVSRDHNLAYIDDLRDDPELGAWLAEHGITLREAARIQPSYSNEPSVKWHPTGSAFAGLQFAGDSLSDIDPVLAPSARAGIRRVSETTGACDHCSHASLALLAEYSRIVTSGPDANQLSLLLQWEIRQNSSSYQLYLIGGPIAVLADEREYGGQAGFGWSLRTSRRPILAEFVMSAFQPGDTTIVRGGVNIGFGL